jgi:hypothetical protein
MTKYLFAEVLSVGDLFNLGNFRPASVQRNYQWDETRASRLLKEITAAMLAAGAGTIEDDVSDADGEADEGGELTELSENAPDTSGEPDETVEPEVEAPVAEAAFYLGTLVRQPLPEDMFEIYDGLQRLTTVTILMAVLRDLIDDPQIKQQLAVAIGADAATFRLRHVADTTLATRVQKAGSATAQLAKKDRPVSDTGRHIHDVKYRFYHTLRVRKKVAREALARFLIDDVSIGIIKVTNNRLARHIFVASNLYQLPLQRDEIFKGQLIALGRNADEAERLRELWDTMREVVGRKKVEQEGPDSSFERFLIAYDVIERKKLQTSDCLGDLIDHFGAMAEKGKLTERIASMRAYADTWRKLEDHLQTPRDGPIWNHVWRLGFQKWDDWRPLAMFWLHKHETEGNKRARWNAKATLWRIATLNRRCMAISLYQFSPESREQIFLKAITLAMKSKPTEPFSFGLDGLPLNFSKKVRQKIKDDLALPLEFDDRGETRRALMLWYEATLWENAKSYAAGYLKGATVEHILPEKPPLGSPWHGVFPNLDERYLCYSSIGNLVLVDGEVNPLLGYEIFANKKSILRKHEQFKRYKTLSDAEATPTWDPDFVKARTITLAGSVWKALELPTPK